MNNLIIQQIVNGLTITLGAVVSKSSYSNTTTHGVKYTQWSVLNAVRYLLCNTMGLKINDNTNNNLDGGLCHAK